MQATERDNHHAQQWPKAIGVVRADVSGLDEPRHAVAVERHARSLGFLYIYTVRPPQDHPDPIGYALGIAAGLGVDVIVAFDLAHVDNWPSRVCEDFDLETVCPEGTWVSVTRSAPAEAVA